MNKTIRVCQKTMEKGVHAPSPSRRAETENGLEAAAFSALLPVEWCKAKVIRQGIPAIPTHDIERAVENTRRGAPVTRR